MIRSLFVFSLLLLSTSAHSMEWNTDRPGYDFRNFNLRRPIPGDCLAACNRDVRCLAWTYVKPGYQGRYARCWLKHPVPAAVPNPCCVSGRRGHR